MIFHYALAELALLLFLWILKIAHKNTIQLEIERGTYVPEDEKPIIYPATKEYFLRSLVIGKAGFWVMCLVITSLLLFRYGLSDSLFEAIYFTDKMPTVQGVVLDSYAVEGTIDEYTDAVTRVNYQYVLEGKEYFGYSYMKDIYFKHGTKVRVQYLPDRPNESRIYGTSYAISHITTFFLVNTWLLFLVLSIKAQRQYQQQGCYESQIEEKELREQILYFLKFRLFTPTLFLFVCLIAPMQFQTITFLITLPIVFIAPQRLWKKSKS